MSLGEPHVKRALDWILDSLADDPHAKRSELIDEASRQFDLTPARGGFPVPASHRDAEAEAAGLAAFLAEVPARIRHASGRGSHGEPSLPTRPGSAP